MLNIFILSFSNIIIKSNFIKSNYNYMRLCNKFACFSTTSSSIQWNFNNQPLKSSNDDVYVISTSSRGIGMEFTKQLLERTNGQVIALHRHNNFDQLTENKLKILYNNYNSRLLPLYIDLENQITIDNAVEIIKSKHNQISLLLNVAGILGDGSNSSGPERSLDKIDRDWLRQTMEVNLIGHVMVTKGLIPLLKRKRNDNNYSKIVNLSARVGSISDNQLGGWHSYRMSKAALNMFTKTISIELKRNCCLAISIHPGTTDTDLSKPFQKNVKLEKLFPVQYSVSKMLDVIWNISENDSGKFYAYDGCEIPY